MPDPAGHVLSMLQGAMNDLIDMQASGVLSLKLRFTDIAQ
jgi:hypothetical protein